MRLTNLITNPVEKRRIFTHKLEVFTILHASDMCAKTPDTYSSLVFTVVVLSPKKSFLMMYRTHCKITFLSCRMSGANS